MRTIACILGLLFGSLFPGMAESISPVFTEKERTIKGCEFSWFSPNRAIIQLVASDFNLFSKEAPLWQF